MFTHRQDLQFKTIPEHPDAWYAGRLIGRVHPAVAAVIGGTDLTDAIAAGCLSAARDDAIGTDLNVDLRTNTYAEPDRTRELPTLHRFTDDSDIHYLLTCLLARAVAQQHTCQGVIANLSAHRPRYISTQALPTVRSNRH